MGPYCALAMALALVSTIVQVLGFGLPAMLRYLGRRRTRANARDLEFSRGDPSVSYVPNVACLTLGVEVSRGQVTTTGLWDPAWTFQPYAILPTDFPL